MADLYNDAEQPDYRKGLLSALTGANNSGYGGGALASGAQPQAQAPTNFGDKIQALSLYATTPEQNAEIQRQQNAVNARNMDRFQQDQRDLAGFGGTLPSNWRPRDVETFDARSVLGPNAVNLAKPIDTGGPMAPEGGAAGAVSGGGFAGPSQAPAPAPAPQGGGYASFAGFDGSKFGKDSKPGSKYTKDAGVYSQAIGAGVDFGRGNLGGLVDFYKKDGFPNATAVGDDKIDPDGPGPQAPIDVIRSDGLKVYQNTTGNPQWEAQYGGGAGGGVPAGHDGAPIGGGGGLSSMLGGNALGNIQQALSGLQDNSLLQRLIAQLQGGQ